MLTVWRKAFGGPKCGTSICFPPDQEHLPVSYTDKGDDVRTYRVGDSLMDWTGTLLGHYYVGDDGLAHWLDLPKSVRGLYTKWGQADGEDDGN